MSRYLPLSLMLTVFIEGVTLRGFTGIGGGFYCYNMYKKTEQLYQS